jgi:RNA polymerase sigma-70 factor (ECF subfamily)
LGNNRPRFRYRSARFSATVTPSDFCELYERHWDDAFRAAHDVLRDASLAEDVTQEVFLRLWSGSGYDAGRGPVEPYVRLLARSRALDLWRRARARERMRDRLACGAREARAAEDPEHALLSAAERELARVAVRRLPPEQRQAVGLAYWADMTAQEAASAQGIPLGTAKSRLRLAVSKLARDPAVAAAT